MSTQSKNSRRNFIRKLGGTVAVAASMPAALASAAPQHFYILKRRSTVAANDRVNIAGIGMGIMGFGDVDTALLLPGTELLAIADCYKGHLTKAKEKYGDQVKTTMNYQEILDNPEVDAVIIATPDHWHNRISIEAMKKGKAVYCEKPMVQHIDEGYEVIKVQKETNKPFQVGSQWASSIVMQKGKELYEQGAIGKLNFVEVFTDRFDALGAWEYSIPPDASPETCDWEMFQGNATNMPFDATRFFRWRNYRDYGTGMAGDLFVHLFTRLHTITSSLGPNRVYATGGLRYWDDGRDVADVMLALVDYPKSEHHPAFNMSMRVNFVDGSGGGDKARLVGDEGEMVLGGNDITIKKKKLSKAPGYGGWDTFNTFPEKTQKAFVEQYDKKYGNLPVEMQEPGEQVFQAPEGYDMRLDHFADWLKVIREGGKTIEGPEFGLRACGPALAANNSLYDKKVVHWDPVAMKIVDEPSANSGKNNKDKEQSGK